MSAQITGGQFHYLRRVKTGDYEHHEAEATLTFSVPEGEDGSSILDEAAIKAKSKVEQALGLAPMLSVVDETPRRRGRPPKLPTNPEPIVTGANISTTPEDRKDPENPEDDPTNIKDVSVGGAVASSSGPTTSEADPTSFEDDALFTAEPEVITDKALLDAITKRNAEIKDAPRIKKLIGQYVGPTGTARQIGADARQKFLDDLAKL